jgi:exodeoxyribonuclease VII large subunit
MKTLTLTILQFNTFVKNILDAEEFLTNISIFGEVTNFKISGGNAYFDLKDENAMLSCVKFGADGLDIKNGDLITVFGKVNFYVKSGRLNFIVARAQPAGIGNLYQKFLILKEKLEKEGLFQEELKKPIPKYSKNIGVVTSETGAVIRDIIHVTRTKNPYTNIIVFPSKVQGYGAEDEISKGIEYFNSRDDIDVIVVARGGGSLEDLAPFNTEKVVRAIYASNKPIISAVGHETDYTLCDFASDLRVPTPSVAAEVAVFNYYDEVKNISMINDNIYYFLTKNLSSKKDDLVSVAHTIIDKIKLKLNMSESMLRLVVKDISEKVNINFVKKKNEIDSLISVISKLNPLEILKNGYVVLEKDNKRITSVKSLSSGEEIDVILADGKVKAKVE